jgi:peptidoglycan/xylan/chitin deacetylase (PgdA/CDA1 family)
VKSSISGISATSGILRFAKRGVKLALLLPAKAKRLTEPGLVVLIYHRIGAGQRREMDVPAARFVRQMQELRAGFDVVDLVEGLDALASGPPPHDLVSITFDDAYQEVYGTAWPVLKDLGLPATVFVPTGFVDGTSPAPIRPGAASRGTPPSAASWDELGRMASAGMVALGSHSVTHTDLDRLGREQAAEEAEISKRIIRERTGVTAEVFAYPRAVVAHEDVIAETYRFAVGADGIKNLAGSLEPMRVTRTPVRDSDGMFFFRKRLEGIAPLEDRLYERIARR